MTEVRTFARRALTALLCLSLLVWSVLPSTNHAPKLFETIQGHLEMIADHGHSHGFEEDLYWAMHGHSHDVADHDHSQAVLAPGGASQSTTRYQTIWRLKASPGGPYRRFRIERPPRA